VNSHLNNQLLTEDLQIMYKIKGEIITNKQTHQQQTLRMKNIQLLVNKNIYLPNRASLGFCYMRFETRTHR
jgi:hypothetical protein